jgi:hypothetical protein
VNALNLKKELRPSGVDDEQQQYDGNEHHNEGKLLQNIQNFDSTFYSSRSARDWLKLRNECLNHLCLQVGSERFSKEFVKILHTHDHEFAQKNIKLITFLTIHLVQWRSKRQNLDLFIDSLCDVYVHYSQTHLSQQMNLTTKTILNDILKSHGSSAVVKIYEAFSRVCHEINPNDFELLFILWKQLFER